MHKKIIDAVEGKPLVPDHSVLFELGGVASYLSLAKEIHEKLFDLFKADDYIAI